MQLEEKKSWKKKNVTLLLINFETIIVSNLYAFQKVLSKNEFVKKGIEFITFFLTLEIFFLKKRYMPEKYTHHALKSLQNASWPLTITDFGLEAVEVVGVIQSSNSCVVSNH